MKTMTMKMSALLFLLILVASASLHFAAATREIFIHSSHEGDRGSNRLHEVDTVAADGRGLPSSGGQLKTSGWATKNAFTLFQAWMTKHKKVWKNVEEMEKRFEVFRDNLHYIETRNRQLKRASGGGVSGYRLGLNSFADLTYDEFRRAYLRTSGTGGYVDRRGGAHKPATILLKHGNGFMYENATDIPQFVDWREKGALTGVKDQGQCGSCWAFSSVAAVEAAHQIATGELFSLSEQELVDCDRAYNQGCNGGLMDYAFEFIIANGGLDTEEDYPYTEHDGICDIKKRNSHIVSIDDYEDVPNSNEEALLKAVAHQPVSVAIDAGDRDFQLYDGGVFTGSCGKELNHAVLAVGYGTDQQDGTDYWIVRNSWGEGWGERGYLKMERQGAQDPDGLCGINMEPSYPVKKKGPSPTPPSPTPPPPTPPSPPSPPAPETVCDEDYSCPSGSTCCCTLGFEGFCFLWGCCPSPAATCCDDSDYCCPHDHPICDVDAGACLSSSKVPFGVKLLQRTLATRKPSDVALISDQ